MAQVLVNDDARMVVDGVELWAQTSAQSCTGCVYRVNGLCLCTLTNCCAENRNDRSYVIWVKAE